jgi:hypothetical protein
MPNGQGGEKRPAHAVSRAKVWRRSRLAEIEDEREELKSGASQLGGQGPGG